MMGARGGKEFGAGGPFEKPRRATRATTKVISIDFSHVGIERWGRGTGRSHNLQVVSLLWDNKGQGGKGEKGNWGGGKRQGVSG